MSAVTVLASGVYFIFKAKKGAGFFISPKRNMNIFFRRNPVDFGLLLPGYNFALVALNAYIFKEAFVGSWNAGYSYVCTPLRSDSYDPNELMVSDPDEVLGGVCLSC